MRARTLAVTGLACLLGACTDSADPMSVISPSADEASLSVSGRLKYGSVTATPRRGNLAAGDTLRIRTTHRVKYDLKISPRDIRFFSGDTTIATVDASGLVTGRKAGNTAVLVIGVGNGVKWKPDSVYLTVGSTAAPAPSAPPTAEAKPPTQNTGTSRPPQKDTDTSKPPVTSPPKPPVTSPPLTPPVTAPSTPPVTAPTTPPATPVTPPVTPPPAAPPVFPPIAGVKPLPAGSHEPGGFKVITDRHFDSKALNNNDRGPSGSDGWSGTEASYSTFTIVSDPTAPSGDGRTAQMFYSSGMRSGTGPATSTMYFQPNIQEIYISVWAKISSNWIGNQSSINKMFFVGVAGGNNQFIFTAYGSGQNALQARMSLQGVFDPRSFLLPNLGKQAYVPRGQWQRWEFVLRCNSGLNRADGTADLWLDGVHVTSVNDINWTQTKHSTRPCNMNVFNWNPTYGGGGASPGADLYQWFDRVYISGR